MTSVKIKFRKSTIENKEGVLYFQLIHHRKVKLVTTRFRLFPYEWDEHLSTVVTDETNKDRGIYFQNVKEGLESEIQRVYDLIVTLEKRGEYTIGELVECYVNQSFNGYLFPFVKYRIKTLNSENRTKTASII